MKPISFIMEHYFYYTTFNSIYCKSKDDTTLILFSILILGPFMPFIVYYTTFNRWIISKRAPRISTIKNDSLTLYSNYTLDMISKSSHSPSVGESSAKGLHIIMSTIRNVHQHTIPQICSTHRVTHHQWVNHQKNGLKKKPYSLVHFQAKLPHHHCTLLGPCTSWGFHWLMFTHFPLRGSFSP